MGLCDGLRLRLCFVLFADTDPETVGVSERNQRLHIYDRISQGDVHVRLFTDKERFHRNVDRTRFDEHRVRRLCRW
jgi:hypothetical protein